MAATGARRPSYSIYEYPEHLNPFHEEDNHSRLRFWTIGRKKGRSSSFSFSSFKDFRNTWSLGSMRKKNGKTPSTISCISSQNSPVEYRKNRNGNLSVTPELSRNSSTSQPQFDAFFTPLPRSRFHERISHLESKLPENDSLTRKSKSENLSSPTSHRDGKPFALPGLSDMKSDRGSYTSLQSNPFDDSGNTSVRASSRKKRRAPLPPISSSVTTNNPIPNITITDTSSTTSNDTTNTCRKLFQDADAKKNDIDVNDPSLKIDLKIIEDEDDITCTIEDNITSNKILPQQNVEIQIETEEKENDKLEEDKPESMNNDEKLFNLKDTCETSNKITIDFSENIEMNITETNDLESTPFMNDNINELEENSANDMFKKVDIVTYKKQNSQEDQTIPEDDIVDSPVEVEIKTENTNNTIKCEQIENIDVTPQIIKCAMFGPERKHTKMNNDSDMDEFSEFDKIIRDIENTAIAFIDEEDEEPKSEDNKNRRVSDMKLYFEGINEDNRRDIDNGSPNPIPKPRRTKAYSKSISDDSSNSPSTPTTPTSAVK